MPPAATASNPNRLTTVPNLRLMAESPTAIQVAIRNTPKHDTLAPRYWIPAVFLSRSTFTGVGSHGEIEIPHWLAIQSKLPL